MISPVLPFCSHKVVPRKISAPSICHTKVLFCNRHFLKTSPRHRQDIVITPPTHLRYLPVARRRITDHRRFSKYIANCYQSNQSKCYSHTISVQDSGYIHFWWYIIIYNTLMYQYSADIFKTYQS